MVLEMDIEAAAEKHDLLSDANYVHDKEKTIPVTELFDTAFIQAHTEFESFDEMVAASPSDAGSASELETVSYREWNGFVAEMTGFENEKALVMAARDHWVAERLGLD